MGGPVVEEVEVRLIELTMRETLGAAHGTIDRRPLVLVRLSGGGRSGWGECPALAEPTYTTEFAAGAHLVLRDHLGPRLLGRPLDPVTLLDATADVVGHPMARAAVEMAALDADLTGAGRPLAAHLGAHVSHVTAGAVVGLGADPAQVDRLVEAGYLRVKLKVRPGLDLDPLARTRSRHPGLEVQVDANGSYDPADPRPVEALAASGVTLVEQPFPVGAEAAHAAVAARVPVPLALDESVTDAATAHRFIRQGRTPALCLKPARLGGLAAAVDVLAVARVAGVDVAVGGMVESGLGRAALVATAACPGVTLVGDVTPAERWFHDDPFTLLVMHDGRIAVPTGPGLGVAPDPDALDAVTVAVDRLRVGDRPARS